MPVPWDIDPMTAARAFWRVDLDGRIARHQSGLKVVFQPYCGEPLPPLPPLSPLSPKADVQGGYTWLCRATRLPAGTPEDEVWALLRQAATPICRSGPPLAGCPDMTVAARPGQPDRQPAGRGRAGAPRQLLFAL
jgi:hypothetical protein